MSGSIDAAPFLAAYAGEMNFIVPFLREGASASHADDTGATLLHAAADGWQSQMVAFLILYGADPNAQDHHGETPLHALVRSMKVPADGVFLPKTDYRKSRSDTFWELLTRKSDRKIKNSQGTLPLHLAAWNGDCDAITQLVTAETVNALTAKGATPVVLAILNGHANCVKLLARHGGHLHGQLPSGRSIAELLNESENAEIRALSQT